MASIWLEDKINFIIFIEDMMLNEGLVLFEMNADHPPPCLACVGGGAGGEGRVAVFCWGQVPAPGLEQLWRSCRRSILSTVI